MTAEEMEGSLLLPQERRDYPRVSVNIKVQYKVLDETDDDMKTALKFDPEKIMEKFESSECLNVSTSGILMRSGYPVDKKKFVAVNMYLPMPGLSCACRALAEVVRCEKMEDGYLLGLKFLRILHHNLNKYKFLTLADLLNMKGTEIKF
ncbi:MAG: PilZ domain-containing protein [Candidatus Goldiibacteriota bacterium]